MADFVIADLVSEKGNILTDSCLEFAPATIRVLNPTLKSLGFLSSQSKLYSEPKYKQEKQISVLNMTDSDIFYPVKETEGFVEKISVKVPFSKQVKEQILTGEIFNTVSDKKFNEAITNLSRMVI